ncbi:MAG: hypothetical protein ACRDZ4_09495 [Egibacteraceae bacterium]
MSVGLAADRAAVLVRIRSDRVLSTDPDPVPPGTPGRTAPPW